MNTDDPYIFLSGLVGLTMTHYFKVEGNGPSFEGVIGADVPQSLLYADLDSLALAYEKFFFASAN